MARCTLLGAGLLVLAASAGDGRHGAAAARDAAQGPGAASYARLPIRFEENQGQLDPQVRFLARGAGYSLFLTESEAVIRLRAAERPSRNASFERPARSAPEAVVRMRLAGANPAPRITGRDRMSGHVNYVTGRDRSRWRTGIPAYARVEYRQVYPGIDIVYYGTDGKLEYDFVVAPGADPRRIALAFDGVDGLDLDRAGRLALRTAAGELSLQPPHVYQEAEGRRRVVPSRYVLDSERLTVDVGDYDASRPLVIDPVLVFSTYLGGSAHEGVQEIAVDAQGFVYVAGDTQSADFPTRDAAQPAFGGGLYDMFVVKLLPGGAGFVYATYLGGAGDDFGWGVAADCAGNAYVGGDSNSIDFPTLNPLQPALAGVYDAVIAKLDPTGGLLYATYLGGADDEGRANVAADCGGSIYVAGQTLSTDFPTAQPLQPTRGGGYDGFVAKLSPDGSALVYSTYLGGAANDALLAHVVDGAGRSYVAGVTSSRNFPTANPVQPTLRGFEDVFVSALSADGSALVYSTYLGGGSDDAAWGLTVDAAGNTYVVGRTESFDYPTVAPVQPAFGGGFQDAFVTKLGPGGSPIVYSTYLGGNDIDWLMDVAARPDGQAFVAGFSQSADFPTVNSMQDFSGFEDAVAARIAADGSELIYSSYFGGVGAEAWAIALDPVGTVYVAGIVDGDLPLRKPLQAEQAGARDGFIARINDAVFCLGREANLIGTPGDDVLFGTLGPDVVAALAGNDTVFGIAGNDLVCGGPGNDRLLGGDGADALVGEEGADLLVGGGGFDWCFGGPGTDGQSACESSAGIP